MTKNKKGRVPKQHATSNTTDSRSHNVTDSLMGRFKLIKSSLNRQQKRVWQKGVRQ
jgi:hypothetical protein